MNWIKNCTLVIFSFVLCFCILVVGDWYIDRKMTATIEQNPQYIEVKSLEDERIESEDKPQRLDAIAEGYSSLLFPALYDRPRLKKEIADMNLKHPLIAGLPLTDTYLCNEGYGLVKYTSDRFGFRNIDRVWDGQPKRVIIGDSFIHGACVSDANTIPSKLSQILGENVLNLGMGSNGPSHYHTYARLFIPLLKPSFVYLNFYPNDKGVKGVSEIERRYISNEQKIFSEANVELFDLELFKREGRQALGHLQAKEKEKSIFLRAYFSAKRRLSLPTIRSILFKHASSFESTEYVIRSVDNMCSGYGCELIISFIPNSTFFRPDSHADDYGDKIEKLSADLNLKFVDGRDFLNRARGSLHFSNTGPHLSPEGYEIMAEALAIH